MKLEVKDCLASNKFDRICFTVLLLRIVNCFIIVFEYGFLLLLHLLCPQFRKVSISDCVLSISAAKDTGDEVGLQSTHDKDDHHLSSAPLELFGLRLLKSFHYISSVVRASAHIVRDHIKVILHVLQTLSDLGYMVHLGKVDLILGHLLEHDRQVFFFVVKAAEADLENLISIEKVCLVITIYLAFVRENLLSLRSGLRSPNRELNLISSLPTNVIVHLKFFIVLSGLFRALARCLTELMLFVYIEAEYLCHAV